MAFIKCAAALSFAAVVAAQNGTFLNNTSNLYNLPTTTYKPITVGNSTVANPSAFVTAIDVSVADAWNLYVGPVEVANTTTTVAATPIPSTSLIPPPPLYYSPWPTGAQNPAMSKNESWSFPKDFFWGVASAAYQVEGAVKADGRGPSIWDALTHRVTNFVTNNATGDTADNEYYLYKLDIARIAAMGVKTYSLTISWSRILPFGSGPVNQGAIDHYNDVIDTCLQYNITPRLTLYHWDLPLFLQNSYGGWLSERIVDDFTEYARIAYGAFGDRVKDWFTVNEPHELCNQYPYPEGYFKNFTMPYEQQPWFCGQNVLLAHAQAYHLGKQMISGNSTISFKNNGGYKIPLTNSTEDLQATQRAWDFFEGWFADPIFLTGDYAPSVKEYVSAFLPPFTDEQKAMINGSADIFAHDAYTSQFYMAPDSGLESCIGNASHPLYPACYNTTYTYSAADGGWLIGAAADPAASWLHKATDWVPAFLHYVQDTWKPAGGIAITEFGFAEPFEQYKTYLPDILFDPIRSSYFHDYMEGILIALSEGVDVRGCIAWSLVDNLEWRSGYTVKFGLQYVNFTDPALPRYYKKSFFEYARMFQLYQES